MTNKKTMHSWWFLCSGFIKFLGPYYMLIITEQRKIGAIFGHPVYQVTRTAMIELSNSESRAKFLNSKDEDRYLASHFMPSNYLIALFGSLVSKYIPVGWPAGLRPIQTRPTCFSFSLLFTLQILWPWNI